MPKGVMASASSPKLTKRNTVLTLRLPVTYMAIWPTISYSKALMKNNSPLCGPRSERYPSDTRQHRSDPAPQAVMVCSSDTSSFFFLFNQYYHISRIYTWHYCTSIAGNFVQSCVRDWIGTILLVLSFKRIWPSVVQQSRIMCFFLASLAFHRINCLFLVRSSEMKTLV